MTALHERIAKFLADRSGTVGQWMDAADTLLIEATATLRSLAQAQESPAGSAGLVAEIDNTIESLPRRSIKQVREVLQRARDRIVELESSGDVAEIRTLLALKSQFAAQQERIVELEAEVAGQQSCIHSHDEDMRKIAALEAQLAAAQADARRYRWLRDKAYGDEWTDAHSSDDLEAFIDAALGEQKP